MQTQPCCSYVSSNGASTSASGLQCSRAESAGRPRSLKRDSHTAALRQTNVAHVDTQNNALYTRIALKDSPPHFLLPAFTPFAPERRFFSTSTALTNEEERSATASPRPPRQSRGSANRSRNSKFPDLLTCGHLAVDFGKVEVEARRLAKEATYGVFPITAALPEQKLFELCLWMLHQQLPLCISTNGRASKATRQPTQTPLPSWARLRRSRRRRRSMAELIVASEQDTPAAEAERIRRVPVRDATWAHLLHAKYDELLARMIGEVNLFGRAPTSVSILQGKQAVRTGAEEPITSFFEANIHCVRRFSRLVEAAKIRGAQRTLVALSKQLQGWTELAPKVLLDAPSAATLPELRSRARRLLTHVEIAISALLRHLKSHHFNNWRAALLSQLDGLTSRLVRETGSEEVRRIAQSNDYFLALLQICCYSTLDPSHKKHSRPLQSRPRTALVYAPLTSTARYTRLRTSKSVSRRQSEHSYKFAHRVLRHLSGITEQRRQADLPADSRFLQLLLSATSRLVSGVGPSPNHMRADVTTSTKWRVIRLLASKMAYNEWGRFRSSAAPELGAASKPVRALCALIEFELRLQEPLIAASQTFQWAKSKREEPDLTRLHALVKTLGEWLGPLRDIEGPLMRLEHASLDEQLAAARSIRALARAWRLMVRIHLSRRQATHAVVISRKIINLEVSGISNIAPSSHLLEIRKAQRSAIVAMIAHTFQDESGSQARRLTHTSRVLHVAMQGISKGVWDAGAPKDSSRVRDGLRKHADSNTDPREDLLRVWARVLGSLATERETMAPRSLLAVLLLTIKALEVREADLLELTVNTPTSGRRHAPDGPIAHRLRAWRTRFRQVVFRDPVRLQSLLNSALRPMGSDSPAKAYDESCTMELQATLGTARQAALANRFRHLMRTLQILRPRTKECHMVYEAMREHGADLGDGPDSMKLLVEEELLNWRVDTRPPGASADLNQLGQRSTEHVPSPTVVRSSMDACIDEADIASEADQRVHLPPRAGCTSSTETKELECGAFEHLDEVPRGVLHQAMPFVRPHQSLLDGSITTKPSASATIWKTSWMGERGSSTSPNHLHNLNSVPGSVDEPWRDNGSKGRGGR